MNHIIIDVESLSIRTCPVITSFACVLMKDDGTDLHEDAFTQNIRIEDQIRTGSQVDSATLVWWAQQKHEIFQNSLNDPVSPKLFCEHLAEWWMTHVLGLSAWSAHKEDFLVWASDPLLDFGGTARLHEANGFILPWSHRQQRDARTLRWLVDRRQTNDWQLPVVPSKIQPVTPHDAKSDALALAREIWRNSQVLGIPL